MSHTTGKGRSQTPLAALSMHSATYLTQPLCGSNRESNQLSCAQASKMLSTAVQYQNTNTRTASPSTANLPDQDKRNRISTNMQATATQCNVHLQVVATQSSKKDMNVKDSKRLVFSAALDEKSTTIFLISCRFAHCIQGAERCSGSSLPWKYGRRPSLARCKLRG